MNDVNYHFGHKIHGLHRWSPFYGRRKAQALSYLYLCCARARARARTRWGEREREVTKTVDRDQTLQDWNWKVDFQKAGKKVTCIVLGSFTFCLPKQ